MTVILKTGILSVFILLMAVLPLRPVYAETIKKERTVRLISGSDVYRQAADEVLQNRNMKAIFEKFDLSGFSDLNQTQIISDDHGTRFQYDISTPQTFASEAPESHSNSSSWFPTWEGIRNRAYNATSAALDYVGAETAKQALIDFADHSVRGIVRQSRENFCEDPFESSGYRLAIDLSSSGLLVRNTVSELDIDLCVHTEEQGDGTAAMTVLFKMKLEVGPHFSSLIDPDQVFEELSTAWLEAFKLATYGRQNEIMSIKNR